LRHLTFLVLFCTSPHSGSGDSGKLPLDLVAWIMSLREFRNLKVSYEWIPPPVAAPSSSSVLPIVVLADKSDWIVWTSRGGVNWCADAFTENRLLCVDRGMGASRTLVYDKHVREKLEAIKGDLFPRFVPESNVTPNPVLMPVAFLLLGLKDFDGKPAKTSVGYIRFSDLSAPLITDRVGKYIKEVNNERIVIGGVNLMGERVVPILNPKSPNGPEVAYPDLIPDAVFTLKSVACQGINYLVVTNAAVELPWFTASIPFVHSASNPTMYFKFEYKERCGKLIPIRIEMLGSDKNSLGCLVAADVDWKILEKITPLSDRAIPSVIADLTEDTKDIIDSLTRMRLGQ